MKEKLKLLLEFVICFVICFVLIYLFVFFGGWKLFESGNVILIEVGVSVVLAFYLFMLLKAFSIQSKEIKELKKRIETLEERIKDNADD